ncbi:MAG TPA: HAD-IA family hydrolase [Deltaproteobacteria bacterium]|nr:HAD-IA family hydrolase [Deltaproteobacteria bacterium]HOM30219.1 HAD-IA family hydrolase [Deltaproteobacteria bacterium]HPP81165.1 HAD-IA family hydrolase [Deltaproteobacteria bacterium]
MRAVIFDMDGTLLDTIEDIARSMNEALGLLGFPAHPVDRYLDFVGDGIDALARRALPGDVSDDALVHKAVLEMRRIYASSWACTTRPFAGVPEMLDVLAARGVKMAILSNKLDAFTKDMAATLLPRWRFEVVQGLEPGLARKPDPEGALRCARLMGVAGAECAFVGDSVIDILTGKSAGMMTVGVLWGYQDGARLASAGADALVAHPSELPDALLS